MYYAETFRTKWHDTDAGGCLRPSAVVMYMQETANLQLRKWGCDVNSLHHDRRMGFLLSRIALRIEKPIRAYEDIEVRTWCIDNRGYNFIRCFSVHRLGADGGDEMTALAVSHWALVDVHDGKMIRTTDFRRDFPYGDLPDESVLPRRIRIPATADMEVVGERKIVYSDLDFNRHMNNTKYPDMICDFLPSMDGKWVTTLSLSYLREGAFGDTLTIHRAPVADTPDAYLIRTTRPDGTVCLEAEIRLSDV